MIIPQKEREGVAFPISLEGHLYRRLETYALLKDSSVEYIAKEILREHLEELKLVTDGKKTRSKK